jgi:PAS domain S-box-containing protein
MATTPDYVRLASGATRALTDAIFDALREAVLVVDTHSKHLPIILANPVARRCFLSDADAGSLIDCSLYSLLGSSTDTAVQAVLAALTAGRTSTRTLTWRFPRGKLMIPTEFKLLATTSLRHTVMVTFVDPSVDSLAEPGVLSAIEQLPLDLLILDRELTVTYANAGAARTAGSLQRQMLGYSALALVPTSAVPREAFVGALEGIHYRDEAIAVKTPGEPTRWFEIDVQPLAADGDIVGVAILSMEVTERRVKAPAEGSDYRRLRALTEHARDIISIADRDGKWQYMSGGVTNALGYTAEERYANCIFQLIHPEDLDELKSKFQELIAGTASAFTHQYRIRHRDGSYRWLESSWVSALDNPLVSGIVVNGRDITERKEAEHTLAQREEVFRLATDAVNGIIFEWDLLQGVVHWSRGIKDVLGIDPRELQVQGAWTARVHPQDIAGYEEKIAAAMDNGRGWTATYRIRDAQGNYRFLLERGLIQRSAAGSPQRAIGCAVDVSEIRRLTDLLAETQHTARMGAWEYTYETRELVWTDEMYSIYETRREEFGVTWHSMMAQCPLETRLKLAEAIARAEATDGRLDLEIEILTLKNQRLWVHLLGQMAKQDGRPVRALGSVRNIQEQKLAQIALENSTEWLKLSMNMAHMHPWRWDRATDALEFAMNDPMENLQAAFPAMQKLLSRVHPEDRLAVRRAIDRAFAQHIEVQEEFRLKSLNGRYRAFAAVARPLFDAANRPSGLVGVTQDITRRHESEARLRRSEELLRTTTSNTADTLLLLDNDLRVCFINREERGMSIEEIVGQDVAVLLPEPARTAVSTKLRRVLQGDEPVTYEFDCPSAPGTQYFESRAVLVREGGFGTGISITVRNITERRRLEQEILDISTRERQTIGRDLHDGLGQELTGVALMLRGLAKRIQKECPDSIDQANEIVALVNQSIDTARSLAQGLLPVTRERGGLSSALRALTDRSRDLYGLEAHFHAEVSEDAPLNETTASHLFRIAQEALTNTARHARATAVALDLTVSQSQFSLRITDDGVGMGAAVRSGYGMGLKIMKYRAAMIGAKIDIGPKDPQGTVVCVTGERSAATNALESVQALQQAL